MTINTSLSSTNFQTTRTHAHKHAQGASAKPTDNSGANTSSISDGDAISAENQVAATSIGNSVDASKVIAGLRQALLQQPEQALQAQGNVSADTVMALLS